MHGGIVRNYFNNGIFSFTNDRAWRRDSGDGINSGSSAYEPSEEAALTKTYTSRAVIINGEGV